MDIRMRMRTPQHFLHVVVVCHLCEMAGFIFMCAALCLGVSAAPPTAPRLYQQPSAQLQQINPLAYYPDLQNYYSQQQQQQEQGNEAASPNQSSRLETLEPDSEVELIPGAQTPQQPPQQPPVAPNIPGLIPGQRVFIVHMPVPGYRPGTIGGYQPVYIVAAGPQSNHGFPGNGYQNAVFLDSSRPGVAPLGYPQGVVQGNPGLVQDPLVFSGPQLLNRPFNLVYQDPGTAYPQRGAVKIQLIPDNQGNLRLAQNVQREADGGAGNHSAKLQATEASSAEPKQSIVESKERSSRPTSAHAQSRTKA